MQKTRKIDNFLLCNSDFWLCLTSVKISIALNLKHNQQTKSKNVTDLHKDTGKAYYLDGKLFQQENTFF